MNRRTLLTKALALAGAAAVAPSVGTALASEPRNEADPTGLMGVSCHQCGTDAQFPHVYGHTDAIADARAEGYGDGWLQARQRAESRTNQPIRFKDHEVMYSRNMAAPTFEAMQADCAARGCVLEWDSLGFRLHYEGTTRASLEIRPIRQFAITGATDLAEIDAWRRGLHDA